MTGTTDAGAPPAAADDEAAELPVRPGVVIGVLVVAAFVMILNETIVVVALQTLTGVLGVTATTVQWLASGFLLTLAVVIPTTGYLLQRYTPRQIFLAATTLFALGTLVCGVAPGFEVLLVGRIVQAAGTALMIPLLMTTVMTLVPVERRGSMMGTLSIVIAVAPAVGPTVGGFVLTHFGWRWMFFSVLPLIVLVLVVGAVLLRLETETRSVPLDLLSVLLSAVAFGGIVFGFATIGEGSGEGLPPWLPLAVGVVALAVFVVRQLRLQRRDSALLDLRPFTHRQFSFAALLSALVFMSLLGAGAILLPLFLQTVLRVEADVTGLAVLPGGLVLALMGRPVGALFDRVGPRPLVVPGAIALAVSMWALAFLGAAPLGAVIAAHVLLMIGLGLMMTPLLTASLSVLPPHLYSHGSAIMTTLQQVAGAASTAGLVTIATLTSASPSGTPDAAGLRTAFMVAGCIGILAVIISFFVTGRADDGSVAAGAAHGEVPEGPAGAGGSGGPAAEAAAPVAADTAVVPTAAAASAPAEVPVGAVGDAPHPGSPTAAANGATDARPGSSAATAASGADDSHATAIGSAAVLRGRVDTGGAARAVITLIDVHGAQRGHARTGDGGGFEVDVPAAGVWYVVVSAPGHQPRADRLLVGAHDTVVDHDVRLGASARPATGGGTDTRPFAVVSR